MLVDLRAHVGRLAATTLAVVFEVAFVTGTFEPDEPRACRPRCARHAPSVTRYVSMRHALVAVERGDRPTLAVQRMRCLVAVQPDRSGNVALALTP